MKKATISVLELQPRTDDPYREAIDLTNEYKQCISEIAYAPNFRKFEDYLGVLLNKPHEPSRGMANSQAKKRNGLHFWSGAKAKITGWLNSDDSYEEYVKLKKKKDTEADLIYTQELDAYRLKMACYDEDRNKIINSFLSRDEELVTQYFSYVLQNDNFSIDLFNEYQVGIIDPWFKDGIICFKYRIPCMDEILPLDFFFYDEEYQCIRDKQLSVGVATDFRNDIARKILLRAAATLFLSDEYEMINTVDMIGYIEEYGRQVMAIRLTFPRDKVLERFPDYMHIKEFFRDEYHEEHSPGLYEIETYQLRELLIRPKASRKAKNSVYNN